MAQITFYRQRRQDDGQRTGIEIDGNTAFQRFDEGNKSSDPALLWYVDVQLSGASVPHDPDRARDWLLKNGSVISRNLKALAEQVPVGIDPGDWPLRKGFSVLQRVKGVITCSAVRRVAAKNIAGELRDIADNWNSRIEELALYQPS